MPSTIPLVVPVRFSGGGLSMQTTTSRISADGVFVRSLICPKEGSALQLKLALPGSPRMLDVQGTVAAGAPAGPKEHGFWVRFDTLAQQTRAFLDALLRQRGAQGLGTRQDLVPRTVAPPESRRTYARVPARLRVGWTSSRDFLSAWSDNISRGGIFIALENPPPLRELVDLSVELPDGKPPVRTQAEVVHVVTAAEARASGRVAGAGLQFVGASDEFRQRLDDCIAALSV
jgi:uncharacterized protein (TIGR02266 family)